MLPSKLKGTSRDQGVQAHFRVQTGELSAPYRQAKRRQLQVWITSIWFQSLFCRFQKESSFLLYRVWIHFHCSTQSPRRCFPVTLQQHKASSNQNIHPESKCQKVFGVRLDFPEALKRDWRALILLHVGQGLDSTVQFPLHD